MGGGPQQVYGIDTAGRQGCRPLHTIYLVLCGRIWNRPYVIDYAYCKKIDCIECLKDSIKKVR